MRTHISVMNFSDFLVIYLAAGAPFGVYFFLRNREKPATTNLRLKSLATVFVWIPYAFHLLHEFATNKYRTKALTQSAELDTELQGIEKQLLNFRRETSGAISSFEMREVFRRYAGLTLAKRFDNQSSDRSAENEFFRVALCANGAIGANCLQRRNRDRLMRHQSVALADFLQVIGDLFLGASDREDLRGLAFKFADALGDAEARNSLAEIFDSPAQIASGSVVPKTENQVWTLKKQKSLSVSRKHTALRAQTLTIEKD